MQIFNSLKNILDNLNIKYYLSKNSIFSFNVEIDDVSRDTFLINIETLSFQYNLQAFGNNKTYTMRMYIMLKSDYQDAIDFEVENIEACSDLLDKIKINLDKAGINILSMNATAIRKSFDFVCDGLLINFNYKEMIQETNYC